MSDAPLTEPQLTALGLRIAVQHASIETVQYARQVSQWIEEQRLDPDTAADKVKAYFAERLDTYRG